MAASGGMGAASAQPPAAKPPEPAPDNPLVAPKPRGRAPNADHQPQPEVDQQIEEMCKHFKIEDRIARRLNDIMVTREATYDKDMKALWEVCETAKNPAGHLMVKILELERGIFTGSGRLDRDLQNFSQKYKLDDRALSKLIEVVGEKRDRGGDLRDLERHMRAANNPSGAILPLLAQLKNRGKVPSPPRARRDDEDREERRRSRSRSRSR